MSGLTERLVSFQGRKEEKKSHNKCSTQKLKTNNTKHSLMLRSACFLMQTNGL
ncbi:hypothetical protein GLYMA_17G256600v4 [Glycine max]|uniref:Uncharacterized protein n=1 Tax=Glycine max TaxID=3847 RepID=K7MP08_SOYBN|nr:hypothetical protein GYH30_048482 [Glycine max]KHN12653.1 hypothetical protein glysoja_008616 [Glycine soja]KRH05924.1 hypothetical protein GLYMA_17G256600v4 [Glycine max]